MSREFLIPLPWPPAKSSPNGSQGDYRGKARAGRNYKADCGWICKAQAVQPFGPGVGGVHVEVTFHPPTARAYDLDNALARCKRGLDAVAEAIGVDDRDWLSVHLARGEKVKGGAVMVRVRPVGTDNWQSICALASGMVKGIVS